MSPRRFALIDPAAGISGDMVLGALIDLGAPAAWLRGLPARLGLDGVEIEIADVIRCGMRSTKVTIRVAGATEGPADVFESNAPASSPGHDHSHHHGHHSHSHDHGGHPHRHVGELLRMIAAADLPPVVKDQASQAFRLLAEAEGRIHGLPAEQVALHEVGAVDALIDIVGAVEGFHQLGVDEVFAGPVALGQGWVKAAHGTMPVPTPATALLVEGLAIAPNGPVRGEATTPTGACLLRTLATGTAPAGAWTPIRQGWGAGGRDPEGYANTLRIALGELNEAPGETVVMVATDIDDLNPEYLEPLREAILAAGALDVQSWPTQMKKGRIGFRVEAIAPSARVEAVTAAFFRESTTAGVRRWRADRATLERSQWIYTSDTGEQVRVKTLYGPDGPRVKPEFDDVVALARRTGQPAHQLSRTIQAEASRAARPAGAPDVLVNPKEQTR